MSTANKIMLLILNVTVSICFGKWFNNVWAGVFMLNFLSFIVAFNRWKFGDE